MLSQQTAEMLGYTGSEGAVDRLDKTFRLEHDARRESVVTDRQKWPQLSEQRCGKLMDLKKYSKNHRVRNLKSQNVGANPAAFLTLCFPKKKIFDGESGCSGGHRGGSHHIF